MSEKEQNPELAVEYVDLAGLKAFHKNARFHSERNVEDIRRSIAHFGWVNPIIVRRQDNMIIAGHGRVEAAKAEGLDQVPVIFVDFSENDAALFNVADNRTAETSAWDTLALKDLLQTFSDMEEIDIGVTGFGEQEIAQLFSDHKGNENLWGGMPEFHQEAADGIILTMHFATRTDVENFAQLIGQEIQEKTRYLWHPKQIKADLQGSNYEDEEGAVGEGEEASG